MKHIIIIILTLLSISLQAQIRMNTKQSFVDSTRLNATGDSLYHYQNGLLISTEAITIGLDSGVTGTLPVANGGTGATTLTANKVLVGNGTNAVLQPTNLHWDNTNSRLGIGTSSADGKLDIEQAMTNGSTSAFTTPHLALTATSTTDNTGFVGMTFATSDNANYGFSYGALRSSGGLGDLIWRQHFNSAQGTEVMRISYLGNVGIGTTSPSYKLDVNGNGRFSSSVTAANTGFGETGGFIINYRDNAASRSWRLANDLDAFGDFGIQQSTTQTGSTYSNRLYIASSGNVGIGTSSPSNKLTVNGDTYIGVSTATTPQLTVLGGSGGNDILQLSRTSGVTASYAFNISGGRFNFKDVTNNKPLLSFGIQSTYSDVSLGNDEASGSTSNGSSGLLRANNSGGAGSNTSGGSVFIRTGRGTGTGALPDIYFQTADVTTSGTTRQSFSDKMTIKGNGNVGIGTSSPGERLHIQSTTSTTALRIVADDSNFNPRIDFVDDRGATNRNGRIEVIRDMSTGGDAFAISLAADNTDEETGTLTERLRITRQGNVGIGTSTPTGKLHIVGNTPSPEYRGFIYTNNSSATLTNESLFQAVTSGWSTTNSPIFLFRDDRSDQQTTQRIFEVQGARSGVGTILTTLANGNVGIGTSTPNKKLHIKGDNTSSDIVFETGSSYTTKGYFAHYQGATLQLAINRDITGVFSNTGAAAAAINLTGANGDGNFAIYTSATNNTPPTLALKVDKNQNVGIGDIFTPTYKLDVNGDIRGDNIYSDNNNFAQTPSDIRLKKNITEYGSVINKLLQLNLVNWEWNEVRGNLLTGRDSKDEIMKTTASGLIAQQVESIFPNLVNEDYTGYKTLSYVGFIVPLLKGFQEQQAIIETLQTELDAKSLIIENQEQKITDLENTIQSLITRIENLENK